MCSNVYLTVCDIPEWTDEVCMRLQAGSTTGQGYVLCVCIGRGVCLCECARGAQGRHVRMSAPLCVCVVLIICVYVHELRGIGPCLCVSVSVFAESAGSYRSSKRAVSKSDHQDVCRHLSVCMFVHVQSWISIFLFYPCVLKQVVCVCVCVHVCVWCQAIPIPIIRANRRPITRKQTAARPRVCILNTYSHCLAKTHILHTAWKTLFSIFRWCKLQEENVNTDLLSKTFTSVSAIIITVIASFTIIIIIQLLERTFENIIHLMPLQSGITSSLTAVVILKFFFSLCCWQ